MGRQYYGPKKMFFNSCIYYICYIIEFYSVVPNKLSYKPPEIAPHCLSMNNLRNSDLLIKFGERVRRLRISHNLTLEQLAFAADMELSQVHRIEKGKINPTYTTLLALASGLEISLTELIDIAEER